MALVRQLGFTRMSFAAPIKEALDAMFGWDPGMWQDREWKEETLDGFDFSPRILAQTLGTEWGRDLDPDFWIKALALRMYNGEATKITISDVRFPNEATWIRSHGGVVVDVTRPIANLVANHSSEDQLDFALIDHRLPNEGGVKELEEEAIGLAREILSN